MESKKASNKLAQMRQLMAEATTLPGERQQAIRPAIGVPLWAGGMDAITRQAYLRRIRFLRDRYGLHQLLDEASGYVTALDCLDDQELVRVQAVLDRAMQCRRDGVSFEDADLEPTTWNCANHVSVTPLGAGNCANHVSPPPEPDLVLVPWHKRPENLF